MGRLLLINGLPGSGKSTLAARYAADRPLSLCLDVDVVRELLGSWHDAPSDAGRLARRMALEMAREVLDDGRDVVVPQLLIRTAFIDELAALAEECGVAFVEVVLHQDTATALERLAARAAGPMTPAQRSAHRLLDRDGGPEAVVPVLHRRLDDLYRRRPDALFLEPVPGDVESTLAGLHGLLADLPGTEEDRS